MAESNADFTITSSLNDAQYDLFVSHEESIRASVDEFIKRLETFNLKILTQQTSTSSHTTVNICKSKLFLSVLTKQYCLSHECLKLAEYAALRSKQTLFLVVEKFEKESDSKKIGKLLSNATHVHYCHTNSWWIDSNFDEIKDSIETILKVCACPRVKVWNNFC